MREYMVKTKKVGDCIAIVLPKELVEAEQIGADMLVRITVQKCRKAASSQPSANCSLGPEDPWKLLE